jgi:hypothetical protein
MKVVSQPKELGVAEARAIHFVLSSQKEIEV